MVCSNYYMKCCPVPLFELSVLFVTCLRVCSYGGGGLREGEVSHLPEVRKTWPSHETLGC